MAFAYAPGLKVSANVRHRARRVLPIEGDVIVDVGDQVAANDVVAETHLPGPVHPVNLANALALPPADVPAAMLKEVGDQVDVGDELARTKGIFGFFKSTYRAKVAGTIEQVSAVTGQLIIRGAPQPVQVRAYLAGTVIEVTPGQGAVIEANAALIQGIFGVGGEAYGPIRLVCETPDQALTADRIDENCRGSIVIGGGRMTGDAVRRAVDVGASAIVSGGIDDADLREILGYDLGVAVTGTEQTGVTLIVTEGFGEIAMADATFRLLRELQGRTAACNGATQIRAGVMRPEIVVPVPEAASEHDDDEIGTLAVGSPVRIIRDPYFGVIGTIADLAAEPQVLDSGSRARVLTVDTNTGSLTVPRANVELIEGAAV